MQRVRRYHRASSTSPAVMMRTITSHPLHLQSSLTRWFTATCVVVCFLVLIWFKLSDEVLPHRPAPAPSLCMSCMMISCLRILCCASPIGARSAFPVLSLPCADAFHHAFSASPKVIMIMITTRTLHVQAAPTALLNCIKQIWHVILAVACHCHDHGDGRPL